jgi:hypothetical protein
MASSERAWAHGGDGGGFAVGAVVAPHHVVVDRLQLRCRAGRRKRRWRRARSPDVPAVDARVLDGGPRGGGQGVHLVDVALCGEIGVVAAALQRDGGSSCAEWAGFTVDNRDADGLGSEVNSGG